MDTSLETSISSRLPPLDFSILSPVLSNPFARSNSLPAPYSSQQQVMRASFHFTTLTLASRSPISVAMLLGSRAWTGVTPASICSVGVWMGRRKYGTLSGGPLWPRTARVTKDCGVSSGCQRARPAWRDRKPSGLSRREATRLLRFIVRLPGDEMRCSVRPP